MIPSRTHGPIDYGFAATIGSLSLCAGFSAGARRLLGAGALALTGYAAATDYEAGMAGLLDMRRHLQLDVLLSASLAAAGIATPRHRPRERAALLFLGATGLAVTALSDRTAAAGPARMTYPPLDVLKPVAPSVWIVDSAIGERRFSSGAPVRMTVIRLGSGEVLLHSPVRFSDRLRQQIEAIGRIRHLVAPSFGHWTFMAEWQRALPAASTWAAPGLRARRQVRRSGLRLDYDLTNGPAAAWAGEIDRAIVPGGFGVSEVALFHRPTRTLLLADLVMNLEPGRLIWPLRPPARLLGMLAPDGRAPAHLRAVIRLRGRQAARAAARILAWGPERVIFAHGAWFESGGAARLRRSWDWLAR